MAYQSEHALEELRAFVAVVEAQGFSAAARAMHGRKATLSKRVQDLEERLGVPLLVRTTRSLRLTEEGRAYFEHASRALSSVRDAEAAVLAAKAEPRGVLHVTTSASIAALVLDNVVATYLSRHSAVRIELDVSERRGDLVRDGFDLAVWAGALDDSSLVARRLGVAAGGYYASPEYLSRRSTPRSPEDLGAHDTIAVPKGDAPADWAFVAAGKRKRVSLRPRLVVTDLALAVRAAAAGLGIVRAPRSVAEPYLAKRQLVPVLAEMTPPGLEVFAVFPPGGALVPKTRVFVDLLQQWFDRGRGAAARQATNSSSTFSR
ncbi:LysR family transcriptional regulator [Pyxidicoccus parkwayensis]|uniref:LysR family transcriptional regulator n=1 Tax=Pyxidicoccus parkwayensis TaxID=2813578 RepID=A0ABX7P4F5_9BACT|nr:LysR family transcriptional regulator [Pyxidicoccus parkwaysis]QSQ25323.1 LysR family transcriptional regulator [Pyxidicoccus parkwaysis]